MSYKEVLESEEWRRFRDDIWDRDNDKCRLCNGPGHDLHYDTMMFGPFEPTVAKVVCRSCHEVWFGFAPDHLPDQNQFKPMLAGIAELVRYLPPKFRAWYW